MDATFATPPAADQRPILMAPGSVAKERQFTTLLESSRALLSDFASISGRRGARAAALVLAGAVLEGLSVSLLVPLLGVLFGSGAPPGRIGHVAFTLLDNLGARTPLSRLSLLLAVLGLLMMARSLVMAARDIAVAGLQIDFVGALRLRLARKLTLTRWEYIARLRHSRVTQLMGGDIQRLAIGIQTALRGLAAGAILFAQFAVVFALAPILAGAMLLLLAAGAILLQRTMISARSLGGFVMDANLSLLSSTAQFFGGLKLAISQNLQDGFVRETDQTLRQLAEHQSRHTRQQARRQVAQTLSAAFFGAALLVVGFGWLGIAPSVLVALSVLVIRMIVPVGQIQQGVQQFASLLPIYEKMRALERELNGHTVEALPTSLGQKCPDGEIIFENVSYRHVNEGGEMGGGLLHCDLTIPQGEFVAITGVSGSGKTTLADLLAGLFPPQSGIIRIGSGHLQGSCVGAWRDALSYVSQDAFLFHDTIRRNLAWANPAANEMDMWDVLTLTGVDGLVRRLEKGLDTPVGERGTLISGGERQRIALARALLRKPKLLVLDEATSALDSAAENAVLAALRTVRPAPTIVLIAHRMENLAICDRVVSLDRCQSRARP